MVVVVVGGPVVSVLALYYVSPIPIPLVLSDYSGLGSDATRGVVERSVIVPHNCHYNHNGWLKYDHRLMYKKYTNPCPSMVCGVVERHLEMAQPTTKITKRLQIFCLLNALRKNTKCCYRGINKSGLFSLFLHTVTIQ